MPDRSLHDTYYVALGFPERLLMWLYAAVLILAAAALIKYLFFR